MRPYLIVILMMLLSIEAHSQGNDDPWLAIEEGWIWEVVDEPRDLAGRWLLPAGTLESNITYRMTLAVTGVEGTIALFLGDAERILITSPGEFSYDFTANDRKRMVFKAIGLESGRARLEADSIRVAVIDTVQETPSGDPWLAENNGWIWQLVDTRALLGGSWWNNSLLPDTTYRISFNATHIQGSVGLFIGDREAIAIAQPGAYTFEFTANDKKRMAFFATRLDEGRAGLIANTIRVEVLDTSSPPEPAPEPAVDFSASASSVPYGADAELAWTSRNADACEAGGGWTGARNTSGSESAGPIVEQTTFSLTCSGDGGSAMSMISVSVNGSVVLEWEPPTRNTDGTRLTDLAGYRIYIGGGSRMYSDVIAVNSNSATDYVLTLEPGDYYIALTALNSRGDESHYSNEAVVSQ